MPIGTGYTAKYLCSQVYMANRDPHQVFENDVKPTNPLFEAMTFELNRNEKISYIKKVSGFWKPTTAIYREGFGCTQLVDTTRQELLDPGEGGNAPENFQYRFDLAGRRKGGFICCAKGSRYKKKLKRCD